jgi:hypothetical protein
MLAVEFHHFGEGERAANVDVANEDILGRRSAQDRVADCVVSAGSGCVA